MKRQPVNPSVQSVRLQAWTGRTVVAQGRPGRTGDMVSVQRSALDGLAGTTLRVQDFNPNLNTQKCDSAY